jgi:hypothetical protein
LFLPVYGYKSFEFSDLNYSDNSSTEINLFKDKEKTIMLPVESGLNSIKNQTIDSHIYEPMLTNDQMTKFYEY